MYCRSNSNNDFLHAVMNDRSDPFSSRMSNHTLLACLDDLGNEVVPDICKDNIDIHPIHCCESACENSINFVDEKSLDNLVLSTCTKNLSRIALNAFVHDNSKFSEYYIQNISQQNKK